MINIVVAWMAEARPLIDRYRLKPLSRKSGFRIYRNGDIRLIVAGQGKVAAAAATAWLQALLKPEQRACWLNVGIAGQRDLPIGTAIEGCRVSDLGSGRYWLLPDSETGLPALDIVTVDAPDPEYQQDAVMDMEASGFVETALRFAEQRDIGCFKVISDNAQQKLEGFTPSMATELMAARIDELCRVVEALQGRVASVD